LPEFKPFLGVANNTYAEEMNMQPTLSFGKALAGAAFALALSSVVGFAASDFAGTWKVQDSKGNPFQITLSEDGTAKGDRSGEGLTGTWKEKENSAVIKWDSGWTTKITKDGNQYKKTASEKGKPEGAASDAQKVQ
jgi:hypothetical protein